ncbi:hypothetical protein ACFZDF_33950 [Streptomyces sp. NPDC007910]|uniref:hypothetical protein n=1 Tax=Streptomyces sp. NPDC007910 TaxID=3364790 RepID=UPI0036E0BF06
MGSKPSVAARAATTEPTTAGSDTTLAATRNELSSSTTARFGMPHALVIVACIATAAILTKLGMTAQDALFLIAGAGGIGATIIIVAMAGGRRNSSRISRFLSAYFTSGN